MTDNELLELAALAAGIEIYFAKEDGTCYQKMTYYCLWNPLTDNEDALRLAVELGFNVTIDQDAKRVDVISQGGETSITQYFIENRNDPYAATRRAIVRVAAEIGKELK